jgi:hypothetical protein
LPHTWSRGRLCPDVAKHGKATMGEQLFDDLARGLDDGTISRRRALKLAGGALLATVVPPLFPREAEARNRAKRRCRRRGGIYLSRGTCHCAITCDFASDQFTCQSDPGCTCFMTVTGRGFCAKGTGRTAVCSSSADCEPSLNEVCVVNPGCADSGGTCTTSAQCQSSNPNYACVNGTCQLTACASPC